MVVRLGFFHQFLWSCWYWLRIFYILLSAYQYTHNTHILFPNMRRLLPNIPYANIRFMKFGFYLLLILIFASNRLPFRIVQSTGSSIGKWGWGVFGEGQRCMPSFGGEYIKLPNQVYLSAPPPKMGAPLFPLHLEASRVHPCFKVPPTMSFS